MAKHEQLEPVKVSILLDLAGIKPAPTRKAIALVFTEEMAPAKAAEAAGMSRQNLAQPLKKFVQVRALADLYAENTEAARHTVEGMRLMLESSNKSK
ncbi:MAG: hypothetical protein CMB99_16215 [Flavobacteriaceae bacterium]|nr:hypothetical protein [Flavobacteriaceae bacterium]|tara:strand:- start:15133 stop:15423 length:291 start_codon:yes stop_codon:yes gene_type:complete